MGLEYLKPELIDEAPGNWRVHTDEQRIALQTLLDQVGIAGAIVVYDPEPAHDHPSLPDVNASSPICANSTISRIVHDV